MVVYCCVHGCCDGGRCGGHDVVHGGGRGCDCGVLLVVVLLCSWLL